MDVIALRAIRALGRHGADPGEREREQPFEVDLFVEADLSRAERTDRLEDTIDYAALHRTVVEIIRSTSFVLLERLAAEILHAVFSDKRVVRAEIEIAKPGLLDGATAAVRLRRNNSR